MVIYEVNLTIDNEIFKEYKVWLDEHILQMLKFPGFLKANVLSQFLDDSDLKDKKQMTVQYEIESKQDLQNYFDEYAAKMQGDGVKKFSGRFSATRRMFEVEETIDTNEPSFHV